MKARVLACLALSLLAGMSVRAEFSAEKLALIDRPFQGEFAALSPDGKYLAVTDYDDDGKLRLSVLDLDRKTGKQIPLVDFKNKRLAAPRLAALRWATSERLVLVNSDSEIIAIDPDGKNAVRLWEKNDTGLVSDGYLKREPYVILPALPRILPPLADDPGHILLESVATLGVESLSNAYRIDVRTGESQLANGDYYLSWQVALYGRGDMLMWPPMPNGNWSLVKEKASDPPPMTLLALMRESPLCSASSWSGP